MAAERSVLHVLPHPGGGGETYVDLLEEMPGYRFSRVYLAPSPRPSPAIARGVVEVARQARRHDLVHVHGEVVAALCLPLLATRPSVVTLNGLHLARRLHGVALKVAALNLRAALRAADCMICVSQTEHDELARVVGLGPAQRAMVVRNGVRVPHLLSDADRAAVRDELGIPHGEVVAIWVGSLDERKDPLAAVRAAGRAGVSLLVVGDGPLRHEVELAAKDGVRVLGPRRDVPRLLAACDIYVLTSHREGLAFSLLEAMSCGLPSVVTNLPENIEAIGEAGITAQIADVDAAAQALWRLAESEVERSELSDRARRRVGELFDAEAMVRQTRAVYDKVLAHHR